MMKFVIIQCVKAYHSELEQIFRSIEVDAYSEMDVEGFIRNNQSDEKLSNWFGTTANSCNYMVSFTFLGADKAEKLLKRIENFNESIKEMSPMNAYIMNVEKSI